MFLSFYSLCLIGGLKVKVVQASIDILLRLYDCDFCALQLSVYIEEGGGGQSNRGG